MNGLDLVEARRAGRNAAPLVGTYICHPSVCIDPSVVHSGLGPHGHCWHRSTWHRLQWQHGRERAEAVMEGQDAKSQADLAAWNRLGTKRKAAA